MQGIRFKSQPPQKNLMDEIDNTLVIQNKTICDSVKLSWRRRGTM